MQWWPARIATATRSSSVATSWAWTPGSVNVTMPARTARVGRAEEREAGDLARQHVERVLGERALVGRDLSMPSAPR